MNKFKTILQLFCFIGITQTAVTQTNIPVLELKHSIVIPINKPIQMDSLDVNLKAFDKKNILQNNVNFDLVRESKNVLQADGDTVFRFKNTDSEYAMQLLSFNIDVERYTKATLKITSTDYLDIFINDKKEKSKETTEDSLIKAKSIEVKLNNMDNYHYEVIIKRITEKKENQEVALKIMIQSEKSDSLTQFTVSCNELRPITIYDILEGKRLEAGSLSPTGTYYWIDESITFEGGKKMIEKELRRTKNNQTLYRFPSNTTVSWVSEKDQLLYARSGEKEKDIILLDIPTLTETVLIEGVKYDSYKMLPNGKGIIFTVTETIPADKGDLTRLLSPSDRNGSFRSRTNIYHYSITDKTMRILTFGRSEILLADVSPDSRKLLCIKSEETITKRPFTTNILFEIDLETLQLDTLFIDDFLSKAIYSPNGKQLLLTGAGELFDGIGLNITQNQISNTYNTEAFIYDLQTKKITPVTQNFNPKIESAIWSVYDNKIYFRAQDKDYLRLYQYDTKTKQFNLLDLPEDLIWAFNLAETEPLLLFRGEGSNNSDRLYIYDLKKQKTTLLADPFKKQLSQLKLSPVIDWNFTSLDSTTIYGRYYLPPNFDSSQKYPMIVYYYAGTSPTLRNFESTYPLQVYAAQGYVIYTLQPSGTTGFGQEFAARHVNAWGKLTADEIIEGTQKFYRTHSFIDSTKIGCIGASYGGFMTQYLQTQTQIFAAAVSHAGISNIASYWGEGYWGYAYSASASAYSYPWNNPDLYVNQSPLFQADKINTPLLLLHGSEDTNVPVGESVQMYNALKILGKEVEFIQVKGENHAIYNYQKRIAWNKTIYAWFARWLKEQPEWWFSLYPER